MLAHPQMSRNAPILLHEEAEYGIATTCCYAMLKCVSPAASVPVPLSPHPTHTDTAKTALCTQDYACCHNYTVICYIAILDCFHHLILFVTVTWK